MFVIADVVCRNERVLDVSNAVKGNVRSPGDGET